MGNVGKSIAPGFSPGLSAAISLLAWFGVPESEEGAFRLSIQGKVQQEDMTPEFSLPPIPKRIICSFLLSVVSAFNPPPHLGKPSPPLAMRGGFCSSRNCADTEI